MVVSLFFDYWQGKYDRSETPYINRQIIAKGKKIGFALNNSFWWTTVGSINERFLSICSSSGKSALGPSN